MASASPGNSGKSSPLASPRRERNDKMNSSMRHHSNDDQESPIPGINERLGYLRPSRELLEYYRKKIAEYDEEHDSVVAKLEEYRVTYEEQHKLQWELRQREEEITELQKALSDMQIYLFQEREHVLRLYAENDRLKIRELEDKKKIQQLLALSGTPDSEITYFHKEPPAKAVVEQKAPKRAQSATLNTKNNKKQSPSGKSSVALTAEQKRENDTQALSLQIESLQSQIQDQAKLAKEQVNALMEDRRVKEEEMETRRQRDEAKIHTLTEKLHKTQDLLYESTKDFLELRYQGRANERQWMSEKDKLLRDLDQCKQQMNIKVKDSALDTSNLYESRSHYIEELKSMEYQLQQSQKLSEMYREQVIQLEDELGRIREEGDVTREIFKDRGDKMSKRLKLMNQRYQDLERRRNLEVEGFKTDIKNLRTRLKEVERQLYKVTIGFSEDMDAKRPDDIDMQILRNIRATSGRSKKMTGELKNLKAKIYSIENDLKHL